MNILTVNAGSSSIKYKVYHVTQEQSSVFISGLIEGIGETKGAWRHNLSKVNQQFKHHQEAFSALAKQLHHDLKKHPIIGIGHRVVHGGNLYYQPTIITDEVLTAIKELAQLAPIHNPINALGIQFTRQHYPNALQVAVFDSGFHHTMPPHVRQYAIDSEVANCYQIKRYGFHGINHEYVAKHAAQFLKKTLNQCNFISLHLGNGASACLIKKGESFDTSMGMTPLAGLVMGTRCGDIDPAIVLYLQEQGLSPAEVDKLLNKQSGLKGIAKENDMRKLIERVLAHDDEAKLAIEMYVYAIQKIIGAYLSQTTRLDALIFTGGVGENAALIREKVLASLQHFGFKVNRELNSALSDNTCHNIAKSGIPILVIRGDEEALIAQKVAKLLQPINP